MSVRACEALLAERGRRSGVDRRRHVLRLDVEGLRGLAGGALDRASHRRDERVRGRVRQRVVRHAGGAASGRGHARRGARAAERARSSALAASRTSSTTGTCARASCSTSATAPRPALLVKDGERNELLGSHGFTDGSLSLQVKVARGGSVHVGRRLPFLDVDDPAAMKERLDESSLRNFVARGRGRAGAVRARAATTSRTCARCT